MGISLSVILAVVGVFIFIVHPFPGAQWLGGLLFIAGFYVAYRVGKKYREMHDFNDREAYK